MNTYWISFATDDECLGICIVDAISEHLAIAKSIELSINPGGEAAIMEMPITNEAATEIESLGKNRLVSQDELIYLEYKKLKELPEKIQIGINCSDDLWVIQKG